MTGTTPFGEQEVNAGFTPCGAADGRARREQDRGSLPAGRSGGSGGSDGSGGAGGFRLRGPAWRFVARRPAGPASGLCRARSGSGPR
jgi:hypothetical protein